jgi:GT2 family glycosyltransferase
MSLVSVAVVNWNGAEVLPECLKSLLGLNHKDIEIIVVDNGSSDDSVNIVKRICGDMARVVCLDKNIGFAAGVNAGFENAGGEFFAALNNDMIAEPSWLDQPLELFRDKSVGIVSCRQMNYYDRTIADGLYHYVTKELTFMPFGHGREFSSDPLFSEAGYVISANGGSAVFRAETFKALGGYDAGFFGYMEETDFCMRAFLRGWRCAYAPSAVVYHMDGFSFKKKGDGFRYYLRERNRVWFLYKNIPAADIIRRLFFIIIMELRVIRVFIVKSGNPFLYFKARIDALRGLRRYREVRRNNVALFKEKRAKFYRLAQAKKLDMGGLKSG